MPWETGTTWPPRPLPPLPHGILIEIHPDPAMAKSDGKQSLNFAHFEELLARLRALAPHLGVAVK